MREDLHMNLVLTNGFVSEYDDYYLWVEDFAEGSDAYYIGLDEDGEPVSFIPSKVASVIDQAAFDSEEDYDEAVDGLMGDESYDVAGEFITDSGSYYLSITSEEDEQALDSLDMVDVYYC